MAKKAIPSPAETEKSYTDVPASMAPAALDFFLRSVAFIAWQLGHISVRVFWVVQFLLPVAIFLLVVSREGQVTKKIRKQKNLPDDDVLLASPNIALLLLITAISIAVTYTLLDWSPWLKIIASFVVAILMFFYQLVLAFSSPKLVSDPIEDLKEEIKQVQEETFARNKQEGYRITIDENDKVITNHLVEVSTLSSRVDGYTIESALFGGLAFSGFLNIVLSWGGIFDDVRLTEELIFDFSLLPGQMMVISAGEFLQNLLNPPSLFALIAIGTIVCSLLFVSAIIARLRYYDLARHAEYATKLAAAFNQKEEEMYYITFQSGKTRSKTLNERLDQLSGEIEVALVHAGKAIEELRPMVFYVKVFRDLGVNVFVIVLILSAAMIDGNLAILFLLITVIATAVGTIDKLLRDKRLDRFSPRSKANGKGAQSD